MAPKLTSPVTFQPCLMFASPPSILEVAEFYTSIFPNSRILNAPNYGEAGAELIESKHRKGDVMAVDFELDGKEFVALTGGPNYPFKPNPAISFIIECENQDEVDYYWEKLGEGGDQSKQMCGWLADKYGVSWQIQPKIFREYMKAKDDPAKRGRVMKAMMGMKKMIIADLNTAADSKE